MKHEPNKEEKYYVMLIVVIALLIGWGGYKSTVDFPYPTGYNDPIETEK